MDPVSIGLSVISGLANLFGGSKSARTPSVTPQGQLNTPGRSADAESLLKQGSSSISANFASTTGASTSQTSAGGTGSSGQPLAGAKVGSSAIGRA